MFVFSGSNLNESASVCFSTNLGVLKVWRIKGMTKYFELGVAEITQLDIHIAPIIPPIPTSYVYPLQGSAGTLLCYKTT